MRITDQASATSATTSATTSVATVAPPLPVAEPELPEGQVDLAEVMCLSAIASEYNFACLD